MEEPQLANQRPEAFTRLARNLARNNRTSQKVAPVQAVQRKFAKEFAENRAIQVGPVRHSQFEWMAAIYIRKSQFNAANDV